jgi:hypothetical protein
VEAESMAKSRMQTVKDWLVIAFCLTGLIFMVVVGAYLLNRILSTPLHKPKPAATVVAPAAAAIKEPAENEDKPTRSDLVDLFSGASSLALIMFSLLLALAAIIGWQSLRHDVETVKERAERILEETEKAKRISMKRVRRLRAAIAKRVTELETRMETKHNQIEEELRGRVMSVMGTAIGTLHSDPTKDFQSEEDEAYLLEAIYHSKQGYAKLSKLPGDKKYQPLQNLVYYSALLRVEAGREDLLKWAHELREVGKRAKFPDPYLVAYTRAVLVFSSDRAEVQDALGVIREVLEMNLTKLAKKEAEHIEASLSAKLSGIAR